VLADLVDGADVGMIQRGGGSRLAAKTLEGVRIGGDFRGQELQRDEAAEFGVFGLIHNAHPATAELLDDAIVRNDAANHVRIMLSAQERLVNERAQIPIWY
jgi:hypothetical protein